MAGLMYQRSSSLLESHTSMDSSNLNQSNQGSNNLGIGEYTSNASAGFHQTFTGGKRQTSQPPIFGFYGMTQPVSNLEPYQLQNVK